MAIAGGPRALATLDSCVSRQCILAVQCTASPRLFDLVQGSRLSWRNQAQGMDDGPWLGYDLVHGLLPPRRLRVVWCGVVDWWCGMYKHCSTVIVVHLVVHLVLGLLGWRGLFHVAENWVAVGTGSVPSATTLRVGTWDSLDGTGTGRPIETTSTSGTVL